MTRELMDNLVTLKAMLNEFQGDVIAAKATTTFPAGLEDQMYALFKTLDDMSQELVDE